MNFIKEKIINFWSNPDPYVYIHRIGELIHVKKIKYNHFNWFAKTDKLLLTDPLCKKWCLDSIQEHSTAIDDPLIDNKYIIKFYYCIGKTKHLCMRVLSYQEIEDGSFINTFDVDITRKVTTAFISETLYEECDVTVHVNPYYLPVHNKVKIEEMFDEDGSKIVPENYRLKVYVSKINETYQYNYGDILGDITKIKDIMNMYKCDKCKKMTNINNSVETINFEGKDYIKDGKYYSQILCDSCKNGLKNVKWTEHIGKEIIKEVRKDDIVEQIFTIKTNTAIIDNPQNYTIKQNNDKFNIEVPNIKMSLSSPTNDTNYYLLNCVFNYNNHINTFHIRFESIGCSFCDKTKQYIVNDDETEMAHQDGFYISQKNDKIIWYSYPYSDKNNQYITNKDNTYCIYNITNDNWTLYIELERPIYKKTSHFKDILKSNNSLPDKQYEDKQYGETLEEWYNEIKYKFNLFYQHDLTTYSTINVKQKHNKTKKAVNLFTTKYPCDKNTKFIHVIEFDTFNKPLHYTRVEHRTISKKSKTIHKNYPIERFYYYYPQLAQNYLVHIIKDQTVYIKYFDNIYEAYQLMKYEFYKFCNREGGSIVDDYITFQHEVAFGGIDTKMIENTDDIFYSQNPIKSKEEIAQLFENKHLSEDLTFNSGDSLVPDECYFDIKLINNNKINYACIICGHNEVAGYNDVIVYNSNYVPAQNGNFYGYGNIYYTKKGNYCYCEKHYPFPNVLDD